MKVIVLGAGVVGASAAYALTRDGHEVEVIERREGVGLETSLANGGQISASHSAPWASPHTLTTALPWLFRRDAPLVFKWWRADPALWGWGVRFIANCTPGRAGLNTERMLRLALHSRQALKALRAESGLDWQSQTGGILYVFRNPALFVRERRAAETLNAAGLPQKILDREEIAVAEPALTEAARGMAGAILSPDDESGDAHLYTRTVAELAAAAGATFRFGESVRGLEMERGKIAAVATDRDRRVADLYVLALACESRRIAAQAGVALPIYPAKGYSITVPVEGGASVNAPILSVTDEENRMVYSRLGNRLRAAGTAQFGGWSNEIDPRRIALLRRHASALFPAAGDYSRAEPWAGLRPKTPDSLPYICRTPVANLILDTGHGYLGWTEALGSALLVADLAAGRKPELDPNDYALGR